MYTHTRTIKHHKLINGFKAHTLTSKLQHVMSKYLKLCHSPKPTHRPYQKLPIERFQIHSKPTNDWQTLQG